MVMVRSPVGIIVERCGRSVCEVCRRLQEAVIGVSSQRVSGNSSCVPSEIDDDSKST